VRLGNQALADANKAEAAAPDTALRPILVELAGKTLRAIAAELAARSIVAPGGGAWNPLTVSRVLKRLGLAKSA
jgi:hypothetical protein